MAVAVGSASPSAVPAMAPALAAMLEKAAAATEGAEPLANLLRERPDPQAWNDVVEEWVREG